jgi:signal transduction histidine kinase
MIDRETSDDHRTPGETPGRKWLLVFPGLVSKGASIAAVVVGIAVLLGWLFNLTVLKAISTSMVSMKTNTALAFILAGLSLWLFRADRLWHRRLGSFAAVVTIGLGALTLVEYLAGIHFGIDELLIGDQQTQASEYPGRMAPASALLFIATGAALLLLEIDSSPGRICAQILSLTTVLVSFLFLIGYAYGVSVLYQMGTYSSVALHTGFLFFLLSLGILFTRPQDGIIALVMADTLGGQTARRLIPTLAIVLFTIGLLCVYGQESGFYEWRFAMMLVVVSTMVVSLTLVWWNAHGLHRIDTARKHADEELCRLHATLEQRVVERTRQLEIANGHLRQAMAENTQMLDRLVATGAELTRSNEELEQFAYVASHDLQEPLRKVSSFAQLLAAQYRDKLDADANEFIGYMVDGARRMQALIQNLLTYSRLGRNRQSLTLNDGNTILKQAILNLDGAIDDSGAMITSEPLPSILADEVQLVQLFQNLIGNAIKFCGVEKPSIHVRAEPAGPDWAFSVKDNGIGIDPQFADRIFVIFQRLHTREDYPGTGIGLAFCKKIVERHSGRIWVESKPGQGATFCFTLPRTVENGATQP